MIDMPDMTKFPPDCKQRTPVLEKTYFPDKYSLIRIAHP